MKPLGHSNLLMRVATRALLAGSLSASVPVAEAKDEFVSSAAPQRDFFADVLSRDLKSGLALGVVAAGSVFSIGFQMLQKRRRTDLDQLRQKYSSLVHESETSNPNHIFDLLLKITQHPDSMTRDHLELARYLVEERNDETSRALAWNSLRQVIHKNPIREEWVNGKCFHFVNERDVLIEALLFSGKISIFCGRDAEAFRDWELALILIAENEAQFSSVADSLDPEKYVEMADRFVSHFGALRPDSVLFDFKQMLKTSFSAQIRSLLFDLRFGEILALENSETQKPAIQRPQLRENVLELRRDEFQPSFFAEKRSSPRDRELPNNVLSFDPNRSRRKKN